MQPYLTEIDMRDLKELEHPLWDPKKEYKLTGMQFNVGYDETVHILVDEVTALRVAPENVVVLTLTCQPDEWDDKEYIAIKQPMKERPRRDWRWFIHAGSVAPTLGPELRSRAHAKMHGPKWFAQVRVVDALIESVRGAPSAREDADGCLHTMRAAWGDCDFGTASHAEILREIRGSLDSYGNSWGKIHVYASPRKIHMIDEALKSTSSTC